MYCPNCASKAIDGQRFCRNCGTNLGAIVDAIDNKRGPIDFESLKEDLRQLGSSLRSGFEEARQNIKRTQRFYTPGIPIAPGVQAPWAPRVRVRERKRGDESELRCSTQAAATPQIKIKDKHSPRSRQYSLQQATLSIFSGGATSAALYYLFNTAANSGLLANLERILLNKLGQPELTGFVPIFQMLWIIGLVSVAKGLAHLINGIFFAPKPAPAVSEQAVPPPAVAQEPQSYIKPSEATPTNEFGHQPAADFRPSITEDPTAKFNPQSEPGV